MLSFFRRIRNGLFDPIQGRKYLLYALGEFILIVAGILVAMQIDNWNEGRKQKKLARQYIQDIYDDIKSSIFQLDTVHRKLEQESQAAEFIMERMDSKSKEVVNTQMINKAFRDIGSARIILDGNVVYDELRRSGQLGIINDQQLLLNLREFYLEYDNFTDHYNTLTVTMKRELQLYWSGDTLLEEWRSERRTGRNHIEQIKRLLKSRDFYKLLMQNLITADMGQFEIEKLKNRCENLSRYLEDSYPALIRSRG